MQALLIEIRPSDVVTPANRKQQRYVIATKARFSWQTNDGRWLEGEGITKNISADGVFVLTDLPLTAGASIVVSVEMPALKLITRPIKFRGLGRIVRIEPEVGGLYGFAAAVTFDDERLKSSKEGSLEHFAEVERKMLAGTAASPDSERRVLAHPGREIRANKKARS
jgi:hypothetical protein